MKTFFDFGGGLIGVIKKIFGGVFRFRWGPKHFLYSSVGIAVFIMTELDE
jgi:hypothetical protein